MATDKHDLDQTLDRFNQMTREQLRKNFALSKEALDAIAKRRDEAGDFASFDQLKDIPGLDDATFGKIHAFGEELHAKTDQALEVAGDQVRHQAHRSQELYGLWLKCLNDQVQANLNVMSKLITSSRPTDMLERQGEFLRDTQERWIGYANEVTSMSREATSAEAHSARH